METSPYGVLGPAVALLAALGVSIGIVLEYLKRRDAGLIASVKTDLSKEIADLRQEVKSMRSQMQVAQNHLDDAITEIIPLGSAGHPAMTSIKAASRALG